MSGDCSSGCSHMPLFMDFHKIPGVTLEDVRKAHLADLAVQEKYGVKYHQFWLNQDAGTLFCLTEGPDMETCAMVHRLAHGNVACAMTEVEPGYYKVFMGEKHQLDEGHIVQNNSGSFDPGYRTVLFLSVECQAKENGSMTSLALQAPEGVMLMIYRAIEKYNGRRLGWANDESTVAVFNDAAEGWRCARSIQDTLLADHPEITFRLALSAGQPVTENGQFFTKALTLGHRLSRIAMNKHVLISALVSDLCHDEIRAQHLKGVRCVNAAEENFISDLLKIAEENLSDENFSLDHLCREIGISRPQLYRKITSLTGKSPNDLFTDLRLNKAITLLKRKAGNVTQIALEVGYKNPSYFARLFFKRFGCSPSRIGSLGPA